jgi:CDP-diacylglycerol--glycerol-3-phosphate 3-phosphatidyltransferase
MNLPNKITITRIILSIILLIMLCIPWYSLGVKFPDLQIASTAITINVLYIIAGVVFVIAAFSDFLDGYLARKNNQVTDFGKVMDAIADKLLVNGVLVILAYYHKIDLIIPVIIISRDIIVDSCKMISGNKGKVVAASILGKIKTICMLVGLTLTFFSNMPFAIINFPLAKILLYAATVLSVASGCQYYFNSKQYFNDR